MQVLTVTAAGFQLLLPVNMVAQITGRMQPDPVGPPMTGVCGMVQWREFRLPLFRTSELFGGKAEDDENYERIVVLWPMKSAGRESFIGLTSLGPPRVVDVTDLPAAREDAGMPWSLGYVDLADGLGVIPDIDALARQAWTTGDSGLG